MTSHRSKLYQKLSLLLTDSSQETRNENSTMEKWSVSSLINKLPLLMGAIEEFNRTLRMSGAGKKEILLDFLRDHITKTKDPGDATALFFVDNVLPPLIDMVNAVDKREAIIAVRKCTWCFPR
jgi:hypothetical protein|tara:strand:- start:4917 stop:5285 length:369 start_codon:yes stop_codon:yes gene_type:complete